MTARSPSEPGFAAGGCVQKACPRPSAKSPALGSPYFVISAFRSSPSLTPPIRFPAKIAKSYFSIVWQKADPQAERQHQGDETEVGPHDMKFKKPMANPRKSSRQASRSTSMRHNALVICKRENVRASARESADEKPANPQSAIRNSPRPISRQTSGTERLEALVHQRKLAVAERLARGLFPGGHAQDPVVNLAARLLRASPRPPGCARR